MTQFSTNEAISLEKTIDINTKIVKTTPENICSVYEIEKCSEWIIKNDFKKVCLQFPDYLLADSGEIVKKIEKIIGKKVYILGDTAYESCCIDYTAAKHISADAIIHFGNVCFSKTEKIIPCLKIYEKHDINLEIFSERLKNLFSDVTNVIVIADTPFLYKIDVLKAILNDNKYKVLSIEDDLEISRDILIYLGENDRKLMNISLFFNSTNLYFFDPKTSTNITKYDLDSKILKRRYFLSEKIKDSQNFGIVISTLAVKNYLKILERIKTLIKIHGKKYYIISVGKPTVAKLANFPEVDIFVVIGCSMNEIYENRDFYKHIVTPYDLESTLNPKLSNRHFSYDFNRFLSESTELTDEILKDFPKNDISLLTGNIRPNFKPEKTEECQEKTEENRVAIKNDGTVQVGDNFGAGFLAGRSWQGLEQNLGKDEVKIAEKGRSGIAQNYENEIK